MADPRTFVLIGDFQDNITPALDGINNSIARLKQTMSTMTSKRGGGFSDVTQSVGKLVSSQKHLANSIKEVGDAAKAATGELKEYKNMVGKVASAHYHIARAGQQAGDKIASGYNNAYTSLDKLDRRQKLMATANRRRQRLISSNVLMPTSRRGDTTRQATMPRAAATTRMGGGGGRGVGYGGSFDMPAFAFGMTLGQGISQPVTAAILSGFQLGVGLLQQSFQYISGSFAERVQDQMTDLQAAGGYYSIAKRQKNPMFTSLQQSVMFTQRTNDVLERLASDLPGATEDYVKVSKRIGDSVMRLVDSNEKGAIAYAKELMAKGQLQESYRDVSLEGPNAREGATQLILGELTKKTVLAGFGGSTGRGGAAGAYGLPALMERLITNPDTSMAQLQKYAAVFGDPKIMSALQRAMPELEKAGADMLSRTKVINNMLDEISPPEMISAMRKSMAGVLEAYRSAFFSPGTGLFGFGRKLKDASGKLQPLTDVYGRFIRTVEENGKKVEQVVKTAEEADQVPMDVFNMFSDILSNYAAILKPIVDNLYLIWDPLQGIADALRQARIISIEVLQTFRNYVAGLEKFAEGITNQGLKDSFLSTKSLRATLLTVSNLFTELGIFSEADFSKFQKMIIDPKATIDDLGGVLKSLADTFFNSEAATEVGKFFGNILREVVIVLADITDFGKMLGKSNLASGFAEGFGEEGFKALERMFTNIYEMIFSAVAKAISAIPPSILLKIAGYALSGALIVAGIAGLGMAIGAGVAGLLSILAIKLKERILGGGTLSKCLANITGLMCGADGGAGGGRGGGNGKGGRNRSRRRGGKGGFFITPGGARAAAELRERGRSTLQSPYAGPVGPLPPHSFYRGQRTGRMHPGLTPVGMAQQAANMPRKMYQRVGAAPIAPTLQAMGGMFGGGKGGRALIRQRSMMGEATRGMAKMGRFVPGGALAFGALDAGVRMASGEDAGRAIGGAAASTIGATLGGILGQALIPIPGVGAALGTVAGGFIGDRIFSAIVPSAEEQKRAADLQVEAARMQQVVARANSGVDINAAGGNQFNFGDPAQFSRYISMLGLQQDAQVKQFQGLYSLDQQKQNAAAELGKKYNEEVARLRKIGLSQGQIAKELAPLGKTFNEAKEKAQTSLTNLNKQWEKIGTESRTKILSGADNIAQALNDAATKVRGAGTTGDPNRNRRENVGEIDVGTTRWNANAKQTERWNGSDWEAVARWKGGLGDAVASEMKHKPPGSDLVIANSSETVIPAAGGHGMVDFVNTLKWGFATMIGAFKQGQQKQDSLLNGINQTLKTNQQQTNIRLMAMEKKFSTPGMAGGLGGASAGGVDAFTPIAQRMGLQMVSAYRPGDPGWHGANRARDFSNGSGPTPQMLQFAQYMASTYGNNLKELIYTPLGFSIKNGQQVPPYAQASHYNHVHVAYAGGIGNGVAFNTLPGAEQWERSMVAGSVKVASVTSNSTEGFGNHVGNLNVTVNAGNISNPDAVADVVAQRILTAMQNPDSIFV